MLKITVNDRHEHEVEITPATSVIIQGEEVQPDLIRISKNEYHLLLNKRSFRIKILEGTKKHLILEINGNLYKTDVKDSYDLLLHDMGLEDALVAKAENLKAPMPGLVIDVLVKEGDEIEQGAPLIILEAMKMENVLKAESHGIVSQINVKQKDAVEKNQVLISFQ